MIFIYLALWFLGVAVALLQVFGFQPLFRLVPWVPLRWIVTAISSIALWFLTIDFTHLLIAGMGYGLSNQEYISGSAYWLTLIGLYFDRFLRRSRAPKPRPDSLLSEVAVSDARTYIDAASHPGIDSRDFKHAGTLRPRNASASDHPELFKRPRISQAPILSLVLVFLFGLGIGLLFTYHELLTTKRYTSFEECFLAESEGRQQATFPIVEKLCRDRLRNYALPPGFILENN